MLGKVNTVGDINGDGKEDFGVYSRYAAPDGDY